MTLRPSAATSTPSRSTTWGTATSGGEDPSSTVTAAPAPEAPGYRRPSSGGKSSREGRTSAIRWSPTTPCGEAQYRAAVDYGWDLHTHVAGDVAMRQAVDLYMKLMDEIRDRRPDADLRWSLIHAYLPIEEGTRVLEDMARHGIIAAANPVFQWQEGIAFATNLGEERMARTQPFRSYMDGGVIMTSGSDFPVTSHDPWIGIYSLLTRRDQATGTVHGEDETVGIADALRSYTINGAFATYDEAWKGSIEVGKVADLIVVDLPDIGMLEADPELCFAMRDRVLLTLVDGEVRYSKPGGGM
jgi:predicted amidohydrolase YtcJ